jgi:hypothetical protein
MELDLDCDAWGKFWGKQPSSGYQYTLHNHTKCQSHYSHVTLHQPQQSHVEFCHLGQKKLDSMDNKQQRKGDKNNNAQKNMK